MSSSTITWEALRIVEFIALLTMSSSPPVSILKKVVLGCVAIVTSALREDRVKSAKINSIMCEFEVVFTEPPLSGKDGPNVMLGELRTKK